MSTEANQAIIDAIGIVVNKAMEFTTRIYSGLSKGVTNGNKCLVDISGSEYIVAVYGAVPTTGTVCKVFVPDGNFSGAFIINGGSSTTPSDVTIGYGLSLENNVLSVSLPEMTVVDIDNMWNGNNANSGTTNNTGNGAIGQSISFEIGYGLVLVDNVLSVSLPELTATDVLNIWNGG